MNICAVNPGRITIFVLYLTHCVICFFADVSWPLIRRSLGGLVATGPYFVSASSVFDPVSGCWVVIP